jgi:hypothetical protein
MTCSALQSASTPIGTIYYDNPDLTNGAIDRAAIVSAKRRNYRVVAFSQTRRAAWWWTSSTCGGEASRRMSLAHVLTPAANSPLGSVYARLAQTRLTTRPFEQYAGNR